jgi:hypothetical protein
MRRILDSLRSLFGRGDDDDRRSAPRAVVAAPAHLLAGVTRDGRKVIAATLNLSAAGLALAIPSRDAWARPVSTGDRLQIALDLYPLGTVELTGQVRRVEGAEEGVLSGQVLAVRIVQMGHLERALYLQYLGTRGWERAAAGGTEE